MSHDNAVATMAAERYLLDELTEAERDVFEEHYFTCPECAEDVRAGEAMRREMQDVFRVTRERAPLPFRPPARRSFQVTGVLPWAVAAMLVLAVGYQSVVVIPSLRGLSEAQVLSPVGTASCVARRSAGRPTRIERAVRLALVRRERRSWGGAHSLPHPCEWRIGRGRRSDISAGGWLGRVVDRAIEPARAWHAVRRRTSKCR